MAVLRRVKRPRVDIEVERVSKYFKKEESLSTELADVSDSQVSINAIKAMEAPEFFNYVESRTIDLLPVDRKLEDNNRFPPNFVGIYSKVRLMRSKIITPVDTVGCASLPLTLNEKYGILKDQIKPLHYRLQLLVALMLSAQTKDETNAIAMNNLMDYCMNNIGIKEGITLEALLQIEEKQLDTLIHPVGFHRKKAAYIKRAMPMLQEEFGGDVPTTIEGFNSLPGVGNKIGFLALQKSWGIVAGIGVDVHVDRLSKMWRWVDAKKCKTPEHTRKALEEWVPRELWNEINPLLVGFGQVICPSRGKRCDLCLANDICNNVDRKLVKLRNFNESPASLRGDHSQLLTHLQHTLVASGSAAPRIKKEETE
ncbi:ACR278Wp [Eremothecium gossypii ATCC 10895]|uniref:Endonuclease III homolog n=1 Tax=Eremothecium gossypii (strain ATCC 10895 / CBS 109.51 / FGSC 9923 / NRRL Y-1056) TaxID=284811 RepID=Q75BJ3_EREGS|nr:ACR278Wp [Eremothecium gossypii ATCC 10895]AAS51504.1 ACR278Wp [Eremothecium gossypii ATCC 10895]